MTTPGIERELAGFVFYANGDPWPAAVERVLQHAPESFEDLCYGQLAVAIREARARHRALTQAALATAAGFEGATLVVADLPDSTPVLAEDCAREVWEAYVQRRVKTLLTEGLTAVDSAPERAADVSAHVRSGLDALDTDRALARTIESASALLADETITLPPQIIEGVLHQGLKAALGSNSKARKTWLLLDVAISIATGSPWWKFETVKGRVLYINFEIPRAFIRSRIKRLCEAKGIGDLANLDVWTLRGRGTALGKLLPELLTQIQSGRYVLIIVDPIYKGLGGRDENSAGAVGEVCNEIEQLAERTGAAVLYAAHFSKGNQASKEAIDRIGGSGVWTRDADTIITLTKHEIEGAFTVDMILRNLAELPPFVVRWRFPLMVLAPELDPNQLKQPGRRPAYSEADLLGLLPPSGLSTTEWQTRGEDELGISRRSFYRLKKAAERGGRVLQSKINEKWQPISPQVP